MDQSGATQAMNRYVRVAPPAAAVDDALHVLSVTLPSLAHFLLKPSALQPGAVANASVQLAGETA